MKWKDINWVGLFVYVIYPLAIAVTLVTVLYKSCSKPTKPEGVDAVTVRIDTLRDTVFVAQPVAVRDTIVRWVRVYVKPAENGLFLPNGENKQDSTCLSEHNCQNKPESPDSACLILPISQKTYTDDSTYTAWVSGYEAQLDSIRVYRQTITKTISLTSRKRWNWGVQGGLYVTPRGVQPGIGFGVTYTFPP